MPSIQQSTFRKSQLSCSGYLLLHSSSQPLPFQNPFFLPILPLSYAESWQHTQGGSMFGYRHLAAWLTFPTAKGRGFQARVAHSALHFPVLIGFSISFSTTQHGLVELEKQQFFITMVQWEKTSEHFLRTLQTIILHFQNCLAIVPSKSHERLQIVLFQWNSLQPLKLSHYLL